MKRMLPRASLYSWLTPFVFLFGLLATFRSAAQTCDFEQGQNGGVGLPAKSPIDFARGNSNAAKSHFTEGNSVPYRIEIDNLLPNTQYRILISFDVKKGGKYALDYITGFQNLKASSFDVPEFVNPLRGTSLESVAGISSSVLAIPSPVFSTSAAFNTKAATSFSTLKTPASFNPETTVPVSTLSAVQRDKGNMVLWNGTLNSINYIGSVNMTPQDVTASFEVVFTKSNSTRKVVLAWGGHIASLQDWGQGSSASAISGSPYHMFIQSVRKVSDNSLICNGSMDCQLAADAVTPQPTCSITGPLLICPSTFPINYTATLDAALNGPVSYQWTLTNQNLSADAQLTGTVSGTTGSGTVSGAVIPASPGFTPGGTFLLQLQVIRDGAIGVCYLNSATAPGAAVKVNNAAVSASAVPATISLNTTSVSQLSANALLDGSSANGSFSYDWSVISPGGLQGGTLSSSTSRTPLFTAAVAGTYVFKVKTTQLVAPFCVDSSQVSVVVTAAQACPSVVTQPVCPQATGLTYTASATPASDVTYSWAVNNGASVQSANGLSSITVNAGGTSFDLSLTLDYVNPGLSDLVCTYPVTVNALPVLVTGSYGPLCAGGSAITLGGTPAGGSWSGSGVSGDQFTPATAGVYTVTYSYTDVNGCSNAAATSIVVNALPVLVTGSYGPLCAGGSAITLGGTPAGGSWSGSGVSGDQFTPATAGVYTVTYSYTDVNGCSNAAATSIVVNALPVLVTGSYGPLCAGGSAITLGGTPAGGSWSGSGVSGDQFTPATAGVYTVTYSYTDANGCSNTASTAIVVKNKPVINPGCYGPVCLSASPIFLSGTPSAGTWSGPGVSGRIFDPLEAGVGIHVLTYTYQVPGGCTLVTTASIEVLALPAVDAGTYAPVCIDQLPLVLTGTPVGGEWSGPGVSGNVFSPLDAGTGSHTVVYSYTNEAGCFNTDAAIIEVSDCEEDRRLTGKKYTTTAQPQGQATATMQQTPVAEKSQSSLTVKKAAVPGVTTVKAFPNPFGEKVTFVIAAPVKEKVSLRLYDVNGQFLAVVFEGVIESGTTKTIDFTMPTSAVPILYRLKTEKGLVSGMLLPGAK